MTVSRNDDDTTNFLAGLFDGKRIENGVQLWRKRDKTTFRFAELDQATEWILDNQDSDCYVAAGLSSHNGGPTRSRTKSDEVIGIPGVWADIDINGGPDGKTGAAPDRDEALALAHSLIEPTFVVNSGYGLQAWWLFADGVWSFADDVEREEAAALVEGFHTALKEEATDRGIKIDSTFDLARLMRVPGGVNCKGASPVPVTLLDDGGPRYTRQQIEKVCCGRQEKVAGLDGRARPDGLVIRSDASPPWEKLMMLSDVDDGFKRTWEHLPQAKSKTWSLSEYEYSLTNSFVAAGWKDQEICDALVYHRLKYQPGDPKGKNRSDRIAWTIAKIRRELRRDEKEAEAANAIDELAAAEDLSRDDTLHLFNTVLGGPTIRSLVQYGRDPDTCRYELEMVEGDPIPMGAAKNVITQDKFRERFMAATQFVPRKLKSDKWDNIVAALVKAARVHEEKDDTRAWQCWQWVNSYVERRYSTDKDLACQSNDPFEADRFIHVPLAPFQGYVRKVLGERVDQADLRQHLRAAGFERRDVEYVKSNGSRGTRSYYRAVFSQGLHT